MHQGLLGKHVASCGDGVSCNKVLVKEGLLPTSQSPTKLTMEAYLQAIRHTKDRHSCARLHMETQ